MSRGVYLARAAATDVPALATLAAACSSHPWTPGQIADEVAAGAPGALLVLRGTGPDGREVLCASCAYRVMLDEAEILDVAVHPDWRRRGLGRFLLRLTLRRAALAGARTVRLEVRAGNLAALRLYGSLGFAREGMRRGYYREPVEDAVLLLRDHLNESPAGSGSPPPGPVC